MHKTVFAGLTELDPNDAITVDGSSFTQQNPTRTDYYLRIGAVTHRHDGHPQLPDPTGTPSASISTTGGQIAAGLNIFIAYTVLDSGGGETRRSAALQIATTATPNAPSGSIGAVFSASAGTLPAGQYAYALTLNDALGGESMIGPAAFVTRPPGYGSGEVLLTGLDQELGGQYVSWNLWRMQDGSSYQLLIGGGASDSFTDSGLNCADATRTPPTSQVNVQAANLLRVQLPTAISDPSLASGSGLNLYLSTDGQFSNPCLYDSYPIASAGATITIPQLIVNQGAPPQVSLASQGAQKIDPDTELLDWPWKRPVAASGLLPSTGNASGDARVVLHPIGLWLWDGALWTGPITPDIDPADIDPPDIDSSGSVGSGGSSSWKAPVTSFTDLPASGDLGDVLVMASAGGNLMGFLSWNGYAWQNIVGLSVVDEVNTSHDWVRAVQIIGASGIAVTIGGDDGYGNTTVWIGEAGTEIKNPGQASGYVFQPSDAGMVVESASGGLISDTVGFWVYPNALVPIPVDTVIDVCQYGPSPIQIAASGAVTLESRGSHVHTGGQYATIRLRQRDIDEWVLTGDLA